MEDVSKGHRHRRKRRHQEDLRSKTQDKVKFTPVRQLAAFSREQDMAKAPPSARQRHKSLCDSDVSCSVAHWNAQATAAHGQ